MRRFSGTILVAMLFCAVFAPVCSAKTARGTAKEKHPSVSELLDKYAETQDKMESFIVQTETTGQWMNTAMNEGRKTYSKTSSELRYDGDRAYILFYMWSSLYRPQEVQPKEKASYISNLWDGNRFLSYARDERNDLGSVFVDVGPNAKNERIIHNSAEGHVMGFFYGDQERIDSTLRLADSASVRRKMEKVQGSKCYVIEAMIPRRGKYTLWIDPEHGYNIVKAIVKKRENDLTYGRALMQGQSILYSLKNVRFKKVDDTWVPIESDVKMTTKWLGNTGIAESHSRRTAVTLNPNHDTLDSFVPKDIKNGALVGIVGVGGKYRWRDGEVVDDQGRRVEYKSAEPGKSSSESKGKKSPR